MIKYIYTCNALRPSVCYAPNLGDLNKNKTNKPNILSQISYDAIHEVLKKDFISTTTERQSVFGAIH